MEQIIIFEKVRTQLKKINQQLHSKKYFGSKELATAYVLNLIDFINAIPTAAHRRTKNTKHGAYYCTYKHNSKTNWYVSFDIEGDLYNIKNITNNHSADYPKYIRGIK
jgi:hypothetical protein